MKLIFMDIHLLYMLTLVYTSSSDHGVKIWLHKEKEFKK